MSAYYNELDPYAVQWLRNLVAAGHIAPGDVDSRSIEDVSPDDLRPYRQCHFFAGIGVWSYALRRAGWSDDRDVWTGSCPCQPFSAAGKGAGFADERHLWPAWYYLIGKCRPAVLVGEQVASGDAAPWLDLVQTDLEAMGYAFGAVAFPAAGIGAPHIRDRTYWVGYSHHQGLEGHAGHGGAARRRGAGGSAPAAGVLGGMADAEGSGRQGEPLRAAGGGSTDGASQDSGAGRLADADGAGRLAGQRHDSAAGHGDPATAARIDGDAGPTNGLWRDADWLLCRDGKWRPVEPGTFPLAHGAAARVGRLRAYGNAIVAPQAEAFIDAVMRCAP